ncbi:MAG: phosphoribosylglycinamide formyltransferase [Janthinobacterium lividum]
MSRVGILFSGRGSNMGALLKAAAAPGFPGEIVLAISNVPGAGGFDLAAAYGIPSLCIDHRPFAGDREAHERAIDAALQEAGIILVCLAGYMRRLTPFLVGQWAGRMLNVHPSLLPSFPGLHTHRRALDGGVKLHGCTVHIVTDIVDEGPILAQAAVPVLPDDDEDSLAARILIQEHALYPATLERFLRDAPGRFDPTAALLNPLPILPPAP